MATAAHAKRVNKPLLALLGAIPLVVGIGAVSGTTASAAGDVTYSSSSSDVRSKYTWPFSQDSIWNTPIGSGASYVPAGLQPANAWNGQITADPEQISVNPADPVRTLSASGQAGNGEQVHVPSSMQHDGSWNGCSTLLRSDNKTVWSGQPLSLSPGGNPSWSYTTQSAPADLKGQGVEGCHGGSHMSGVGGSLRVGELSSSTPIRHVLKVNLYGQRFIYRGSSEAGSYRWPALSADSCWSSCYGGSNSALRMGALLALPPNTDLSGITDPKAKKIAIAFRDFGAYVVDDTAWDVHAIDMDEQLVTSGEFPTNSGTFHSQLQSVFTELAVVDNNGPTSVGGGGSRRAPLAPCFDDDTSCTSPGSSTAAANPSPVATSPSPAAAKPVATGPSPAAAKAVAASPAATSPSPAAAKPVATGPSPAAAKTVATRPSPAAAKPVATSPSPTSSTVSRTFTNRRWQRQQLILRRLGRRADRFLA